MPDHSFFNPCPVCMELVLFANDEDDVDRAGEERRRVVCPRCGTPSRVTHTVDEDGSDTWYLEQVSEVTRRG